MTHQMRYGVKEMQYLEQIVEAQTIPSFLNECAGQHHIGKRISKLFEVVKQNSQK